MLEITDYPQVIEKKEMEQKMLEHQLNETKEESESHKMKALQAKEDVLNGFVDLMEEELECSICNELFIKVSIKKKIIKVNKY